MNLAQRKSMHVPGHDYGSAGWYFVTVCVAERKESLGRVDVDHVDLSPTGMIVDNELKRLPHRFRHIDVDQYQIMPDHVHAIICLLQDSPDRRKFRTPGHVQRRSLPMAVNQFKGAVTKRVRRTIDSDFAWQRNYFERFIRHDRELLAIREYIDSNPLRWHYDRTLGEHHF
jgi:REP element-mobilizing transposase RayT